MNSQKLRNVEARELSASVEAEWMRDQEKCPKILISRRRGGLFKHQNNSPLILNGTASSPALWWLSHHFLSAAPSLSS